MKFNQFSWDLYRNSERGQTAIHRYSSLTSDFVDPADRVGEIPVGDERKHLFPEPSLTVDVSELVQRAMSTQKTEKHESPSDRLRRLRETGIPIGMKDRRGKAQLLHLFGGAADDWCDFAEAVALGLYQACPEEFLPYNFHCRFHQLEEIHREFSIPLPPVPGKMQTEQRAALYGEINAAWQEFRTMYQLSPAEMCAFLYDYAPNFVEPVDASDLPSPAKVWMTTGNAGDIETADAATPDTVRWWGANTSVRRGDVLLLYLVSPLSAIHSIWRACSAGFVDPFFYYNTVAWMCSPIRTKGITLAELRNNPVWSNKPAVRASFKGPSGKAPVSAEEYAAILEMLASKGEDISNLPRLPILPSIDLSGVTCERDVEVQLVEPFFHQLGYTDKDWVRQLPVRMGRGERNYPDYAFGAVAKRGDESARMIVESKYRLSSHREFIDAFAQAKSYALRLQCKIMALVAQEGIWVFPLNKGQFTIDAFTHKPWGSLEHSDELHEVAQLIGREEVLGARAKRS